MALLRPADTGPRNAHSDLLAESTEHHPSFKRSQIALNLNKDFVSLSRQQGRCVTNAGEPKSFEKII